MKRSKNCQGFTYVAALMVVMIMGITLGMVGQSWKTIMKREREEELIFRGNQYRQAFTSWYSSSKKTVAPRDLKDLLEDPNSLTKKRYIRRVYLDPVTGKDFEPVMDATKGGRMTGVRSTSQDKPMKVTNFPTEFKYLERKTAYNDWLFGYQVDKLNTGMISTLTPPAATP